MTSRIAGFVCFLLLKIVFVTKAQVYETVEMDIEVEWTEELQTHSTNNNFTSFLQQQIQSEVGNFSSKLYDTSVSVSRTVVKANTSVSMKLFITATTTEGDSSDEIVRGILRMKDSGKLGVLPIKSVTILAPPVITPATQKIYVQHSNPVTLACNYTGFPTPSLYWRVNGPGANRNVTEGNPVNLVDPTDPTTSTIQTLTVKNGNLQISSVEDVDKHRNYSCVAHNRLGKASGDVSLILVGVYETVEMDIEVKWTEELETHYTNNNYTSFLQQQIQSEVGNFSSKLQDVSVSVSRVIVEANTSVFMKLFITATTTEGDSSDEIVRGILRMKDSGKLGVLPIKSVTILGLPPPPPTNLALNDIQAKGATVTWQPPHHSEVYEVSKFTVQMKKVRGRTTFYLTAITVGADVNRALLIDLEPDTIYLVRVRAHRKNGDGVGVSQPLRMMTKKALHTSAASESSLPNIVLAIILVMVYICVF